MVTSEVRGNAPKPPIVQPGTGNNIIVNPCQRLNPILECVRNVGKEFGDIVPDFQVGRTTGVLFLSLKYHRLHPEYIHQRIERLGHAYSLRILLLMCDVNEHQDSIRELTKICLINDITVMVAWTADEAGLYLSTFKQFEHKPPDLIKERVDKDYNSVLRTALTSISKVNKTDVETLRTSIGSFSDIAKTPSEQLQNLPGFGQVKVRRIKDAFEKPFRNNSTSSLTTTTSQQLPIVPALPLVPLSGSLLSDKGKRKQKEGKGNQLQQSTRRHSPAWDIELDLDNDHSSPSAADSEYLPSKSDSKARKQRPPSPVWDIELDLNSSDEEETMKETEAFEPTSLL